MAQKSPPSVASLPARRDLSNMPYTNCHTRIVDLSDLNIPDQATDAEYLGLYQRYIQSDNKNAHYLRDAVESIKYGIAPPVAFPTETVYGLGADATNESSVAGIFAAKGRPSDNPLIVHISSTRHLEAVTGESLPEIYKPVVEKFWPGPLTILLPVPKESQFAKNVHPGQKTIGFRMPSSKYARFFIAATGKPIAGPSANSSGKPSPTTAGHVLDDLMGHINFILDGGPCDVGVESTVVDGLHDPPLVLRPGGVSREELIALGEKWAETGIGYSVEHHEYESPAPSTPIEQNHDRNEPDGLAKEINTAPKAPGMKYKHYSPAAKLILFTPQARKNGKVEEKLNSLPKVLYQRNNTRNVRIAFLDRTWGPYGSLDIKLRTPPKLKSPSISAQLKERTGPHRQFFDAQEPFRYGIESNTTVPFHQSKTWHSYTIRSTTITTASVTLVNVPLPKSSGSSLNDRSEGTGTEGNITTLAKELFAILRFCDVLECDYIFAETVERAAQTDVTGDDHQDMDTKELGNEDSSVLDAVADRLTRAATEIIEE